MRPTPRILTIFQHKPDPQTIHNRKKKNKPSHEAQSCEHLIRSIENKNQQIFEENSKKQPTKYLSEHNA